MHIKLYFLTLITLYTYNKRFIDITLLMLKSQSFAEQKSILSLRTTKIVYDKYIIYFDELMVAANT